MNWEAIGAAGEVLGAIAVLVTLGYLAVQMRQNTNAMRISAMSSLHHVHTLTENNEQYIGTLQKLQRNEEVTGLERVLAVERFFTIVRVIENVWRQNQLGAISHDEFDQHLDLLRWALSTPPTRRMWAQMAPTFSPGFRAVVDSEVMGPDAPSSRMVRALMALDPEWVERTEGNGVDESVE